MGIKKEKIVEPKAPRTIKVKTAVIVVLWLFSLAIALIGGWVLRSGDVSRVNNEARVLLSQLVDQEKQSQQLSK